MDKDKVLKVLEERVIFLNFYGDKSECCKNEIQALTSVVETLKRIDAEKIKEILQITLCNGTTDCENSPECPTEDGCQPFDLSKAIVNYLRGNDESVCNRRSTL